MKKGKINKIQMHTRITYKGFDNDEVLDSMLLHMYGKCAAIAKAREVFGKLQSSDIVSWTILISGDGLHGYNDNALDIFDEMIVDNVPPNSVTYASVLKSCITLKTLPKGRKLHMEMVEEGQYMFDSLPNRDLVLWNTLLS